MGGAGVSIVSCLIGGIQLHWQGEKDSKCGKEKERASK